MNASKIAIILAHAFAGWASGPQHSLKRNRLKGRGMLLPISTASK
jgi:hypothetical protein